MKHLTIIFLCLSTLFAFGNPMPADLDSLLMQGKNQIYDLKMTEAAESFQEIENRYPDHPHGYVNSALLNIIFYSFNKADDSLATLLDQQISRANDVSEDYLDENEKLAEAHFYRGVASGLRGMVHVMDRSYVKGYFSGRTAKNSLEKAVEIDSSYYDAYIGLGIVHYYADLLPGILKFFAGVLGFKGNRKLGIEEVQLTASRGHSLRTEAQFMYNMIRYFLEGERRSSISAVKKMYKKYPGNHALGLFLAYHDRRNGRIEKCIEYCEAIDDIDPSLAPLINNLKLYNLAIARYRLNQFDQAEIHFEQLLESDTKLSPYYQSAIHYYMGHLADLGGNRQAAEYYFNKIRNTKETKYYYGLSQMPSKYPMDPLMKKYHLANNLVYSHKFKESMAIAEEITEAVLKGEKSPNPNFKYLAYSILGINFHYTRQLFPGKEAFENVTPRLSKMEDDFQRAWIYIHYARCLRDLQHYDDAKKALDKAAKIDDDYTKIIVNKEKFIIDKRIQRRQQNRARQRQS